MPRPSSQHRLLAVAALAASLFACTRSGDTADVAWAGTVDTLPSGTIVVANPARGTWDSTSAWRLVEDLRIGTAEGDGPDALTDVHDLAVDGAGRLYVLQRIAKSVHVFDSTGRFVRAIGRSGRGPGEFEFPTGMALDAAGRLWVVDPQNGRFTAFDSAGRLLRAPRRELGGYSFTWDGMADAEGRLLEPISVHAPAGRSTAYVRFDTSFTRSDTLLVSPPVSAEETLAGTYVLRRGPETLFLFVPFAPQDVSRLDPRGFVWTANTGAYRIVQRTLAGDTVRVITREASPLPVTREERAAAIMRLDSLARGASYDAARIPTAHPILERLDVAPDGTLWVTLAAREDAPERLLDVFDPAGRYLGQLRVPAGLRGPMRITADALHAVVHDELDVPSVVRLRIVRD